MPIFTITGPSGSGVSSGSFTVTTTPAPIPNATGIYNYVTLKAAVASFLHRNDLTAQMDNVLDLTEARIRRVLRDRTVGPVDFLLFEGADLPSDCGELRTVRYVDSGSPPYAIGITSPAAVSVRRGMLGYQTGRPETIAVVQRKVQVAPALLETSYLVSLTYYQTVPPLIDDLDTNWVLDDAPDVYLYGMLMNFAQYIVDDERIPMWETSFLTAMKEMERARERREYAGAPLEVVNEYTF